MLQLKSDTKRAGSRNRGARGASWKGVCRVLRGWEIFEAGVARGRNPVRVNECHMSHNGVLKKSSLVFCYRYILCDA